VRGPTDLGRLLEVPPLAQLPVMITAEDRRRARRARQVTLIATGASVVVLALVLHLFVRPLDIVWLQVLHRFGA
jgi:hypothetical protein